MWRCVFLSEKTLGKYLRDLRKEKGLTTRELGEKMNYSYSYVASLETGKRVPTDEVLEKFIYSLASNSEELKKIKREISNITDGKYYQNYIQNDDNFFIKDNKVNSMNIEEGSIISEKIYDFPINDISFHLNDKYNSKFFKNIKLDDNDRKNIFFTICMNLKSKFEDKLIQTIRRINHEESKYRVLDEEFSSLKEQEEKEVDYTHQEMLKIKIEIYEQHIIDIRKQLAYLHEEERKYQQYIYEMEKSINILGRG